MNARPPLPGGPRPLPYRVQARGCAWATVVLSVVGLAAMPFGPVGFGIGITLLGLGITAAFIGLIVFLLSRSWRQQLQRMEAGQYLVHWRYSAEEWAPFRERFAQESHRINWIIPLALSPSGLVFAILLHADGELIAGSIVLTYLIPILVSAGIGWVLAQGIGWFNHTSLRLMDRETPEAVIGAEGLYITGQYWPWRTFGQHLTQITRGTGDSPSLDFHFEVIARHGTTTKVVAVPIPAEGKQEAERLLKQLANGTATR